MIDLEPHELSEVTFFAETNFRGERRKFGIKLDDRRRHIYAIGKTGMGKTNFLERLAISDIQNGFGMAFIDPHGDSAEKLIDFVPPARTNDLIYFNPADTEYPIAFNVLEYVDEEYRNVVADGLLGVFKKLWADSWGPRLEYILRNAILALLEAPGNTLLGVTRILVDTAFRKKIVKQVTDPVVKAFWNQEFPAYSDKQRVEAIAPIQNKVGQFLSNAMIRNIVGQPKSTIDMAEIMNTGKILILNLSKGKIGEETSHLLGSMMVTKIQVAAMARARLKAEERKDFFLYVDEFQNFATESFASILSEARKYKLNLAIAHQFIGQLETGRSTVLRDAIFGNVGTMIIFRVGAKDAIFLEKEFEPTIMATDMVNLPKYNTYLRLMIDGVASQPFSATVLPPIENPPGRNEVVIKVSRERWAKSREVVEDRIMRWSGVSYDTGEEEAPRPPKDAPRSRPPVPPLPRPAKVNQADSELIAGITKTPLPTQQRPVQYVPGVSVKTAIQAQEFRQKRNRPRHRSREGRENSLRSNAPVPRPALTAPAISSPTPTPAALPSSAEAQTLKDLGIL